MNRFHLAISAAIIALLISVVVGVKKGHAPEFAEHPSGMPATTGRMILWNKAKFEADKHDVVMPMATARVLGQTLGAENITQLEGLNAYVFDVPKEKLAHINTLSATLDGEWVLQEEVNYHVQAFSCSRCETIPCPSEPGPGPSPQPNPSPNPNPNPIEPDKSWGRARVHAKEAQALVDTSQVKVCVVDTGIDLNHPNKGNLIEAKDFTGKGSAQDGAGHGTHTAGTVGGLGGIGISRAQLLVCKGLGDNGSGTSAALAQCLTWCGQRGAQVVSNSWGSTQSDALINGAINSLTQRGIYVFVASGNDSGPVNWPAKLSGSNALVYAVAASDSRDQITSFSSRGPEVKTISPGSAIVSNWPGGGTRSLDGTSMATPHAAAICAFGIAKGRNPCVRASGSVGGYQFADALTTAQ